MPDGALARRLGRHVELTAKERAALAACEMQPRACPRGATLRRERDGAALWVLRAGWVAAMLGLPDGGRQITRIHMAGDLIGHAGAVPDGGAETLTALTDIEVAAVPRPALAALFADHPRIAALMFQLGRVDQLILADRIAAIGRTDARARLAGFLLDLARRQRAGDGPPGDAFALPLTQEEIGDAIGLTAVHVNRMLRSLAETGLIRRAGGATHLVDEAGLARLSGYVDRWAAIDTDWLPAPR